MPLKARGFRNPGPTLTEGNELFLRNLIGDSDSSIEEAGRRMIETERPSSLLGRLASSEEVANLIVYLSSPQASATTGASMRVDGISERRRPTR